MHRRQSLRHGALEHALCGLLVLGGVLASGHLARAQDAAQAPSDPSLTNAPAGTDGHSTVPLQDLVVTGSRTPRPRATVPANITVVDAAALRTSPAQNPDDLLRTISGVSVLRSYGLGYGIPGQINIRGVPGIHGVLLLADGTPLNEAATGFLGVNEVPECALERIEIVRGPFSSPASRGRASETYSTDESA